MHVDFTPIIEALLTLCGVGISIFGSYALYRVAGHFGIKISAGVQSAYDTALSKAVAFGISKAQAEIAAKGWDHADVKNQILGTALDYVVGKFPDALKAVGLDPATQRQTIMDALERVFPDAADWASRSPATPPVTAPAATTPSA